MTALGILGIVLLCLILLSFLRVGAWLKYDQTGLLVRVKAGPLRFGVYPMRPKKEKKQQAEKKPKAGHPEGQKAPSGGGFALFRQLLPVISDAAGQMKKKIRIDELQMDLLWSVSDPAACAVGYGAANAAVGMIWPLLEQNFKIKSYRIRTGVDFDRGSPEVRVVAAASLTIGQGVSFALRLLIKFLQARRRREPARVPTPTTQKKEAV